jgi:hypothetical protein
MDTRAASLASNNLTEELYAHVTEWATYPDYSPLERAALEYAEKFAVDHLSIDQALVDGARPSNPSNGRGRLLPTSPLATAPWPLQIRRVGCCRTLSCHSRL